MKYTKLTLLLMTLYSMPNVVSAIETHHIVNTQGQKVFEVRFFAPEDGDFYEIDDADPDNGPSPRELTEREKDKILHGLQYWAEVIEVAARGRAAVLNVGTNKIQDNAAANSQPVIVNNSLWYGETSVLATLQGSPEADLNRFKNSDGFFYMGDGQWDSDRLIPSLLPKSGNMDTFATAVHEIAHTLGIQSTFTEEEQENGKYLLHVGLELEDEEIVLFNRYTASLRDDNGRPAQVGQKVLCRACEYDEEDIISGFDLRKDQGYLTGKHITEVLQGSMPGVPVKIGSYDYPDTNYYDDNELSHLELKNGLMSHQNYSNYMTFMEAEIAVLQDLGYKIDRRNFFGSSVYGSGLIVNNTKPYYARNTAGTAFLAGQYNQATLGLGLHVYGSHNDITQSADLLTRGAGAAGIRVDGEGNTLRIPKQTKIHANGLNGRGVMFSYGKDHHLVHQGEVQALGELGVGLNFDFGANNNGVTSRGSWIVVYNEDQKKYQQFLRPLPELQGPLMKQVDISGKVAGKSAAIYISPNALVEKINILSGAQLQGDIKSEYNQRDKNNQNQLRTGTITFGLKADAQGQAMSQADPNFKFRYDGNIKGANNLRLRTEGGVTSLNGHQRVVSVDVAPGSTLVGNGRYTLTPEHKGQFINQGRLSPGNSFGQITVEGDFVQTPTGELLMEVDGQGNYDKLIVTGDNSFTGNFTVQPQASWYSSDWRLSMDDMFQVSGQSTGQFDVPLDTFSPSLSLQLSTDGIFSMSRDANAYSQYASDNNSRAVGQALDRLGGNAPQAMRPLFTALDFSALDGSTVKAALPQLSADAYSMMPSLSVQQEQRYSGILQSRHFAPYYAATHEANTRLFILPMAFDGRTKSTRGLIEHDSSGYGLMIGAERQLSQSDWTVGAHFAYSDLKAKGKSLSAKGESDLYSAGLHARYLPASNQGLWAAGVARLSYAKDSMKRQLDINGYTAEHRSRWSGWNANLGLKTGYRFALSESTGLSPVVSLDYTHLKRNSHQESGSLGSALHLDAMRLNSLRAGVGLELDWATELSNASVLKGNLALNWHHELLNNKVKQGAHFVSAPTLSFSNQHVLNSRSSLNLQAGLSYQVSERVELGAHLAHDWYRGGGRNLSGHVKASWRF